MSAPDAVLEARIRELAARSLAARVVRIEWLPAGLGSRRFARVQLEGGSAASAIARIERPEDPRIRPAAAAPEPPLEPIRALLEKHGLPVPARFGADLESGIELLEDAGEQSLEQVLRTATAAERTALYEEACDLVPHLQRVEPVSGVEAFTRHLSPELLAFKGELFARHALPLRGRETTPAEARAVAEAFAEVARRAEAAPQRLSHRDLQSANLQLRRVPRGRGRLVLIDLQGAFLAPPEYDLVCLLRDSYVELPEAELLHQLERVRPALPDAPPAAEFHARFDALTLTRKGKDLARFVQAFRERGDERYLRFLAPTVAMLKRAAPRAAQQSPALARLAELVAGLPEKPCAR